MPWHQHRLTLPAFRRGFHLITDRVVAAAPELKSIKTGLLHVFILHTSASLTINENADPDVRVDMESSFNAIAPESFPYVHTVEGPDDMPAHIRAALTLTQLSIPIDHGRMALGTWQGVFLFEHRAAPHRRSVLLHLIGEA